MLDAISIRSLKNKHLGVRQSIANTQINAWRTLEGQIQSRPNQATGIGCHAEDLEV